MENIKLYPNLNTNSIRIHTLQRYNFEFTCMLPEILYQAPNMGRQVLKNHIQNLPTLIPKRVCAPFADHTNPFNHRTQLKCCQQSIYWTNVGLRNSVTKEYVSGCKFHYHRFCNIRNVFKKTVIPLVTVHA